MPIPWQTHSDNIGKMFIQYVYRIEGSPRVWRNKSSIIYRIYYIQIHMGGGKVTNMYKNSSTAIWHNLLLLLLVVVVVVYCR